MTNKEYSDLKYKIVVKNNRYIIYIAIFALAFAPSLGFLLHLQYGDGVKQEIWISILLAILMIGLYINPWRNLKKELDELFKSKTSYEEAEKKLRLRYEPPKD